MIIDLELFHMHLLFKCTNVVKCLCYVLVGYDFRRILLPSFLYLPNIIYYDKKKFKEKISLLPLRCQGH